tara:strand:+ start:101 stop:694 length:594 start_codon:yes stop_codon:yes gene_type:complete
MNLWQKLVVGTAVTLALGTAAINATPAEAQELQPNSRTDRYLENFQDRRGNPYTPDYDRGRGAERYYYDRINPPYEDANNRYLYPREQFEQTRTLWRFQREQCLESGYRNQQACSVYESGDIPTSPVLARDPITGRTYWQEQAADPRGSRYGLATDRNAGGDEYQQFLREREAFLDSRREYYEDRNRRYRGSRGPRY